jgi:acetyl/propionyl-CoA carboxylase alpha subunit
MESRVYAEDPLRGFLPSTGPLLTYKEPTHLFKDLEVRAFFVTIS